MSTPDEYPDMLPGIELPETPHTRRPKDDLDHHLGRDEGKNAFYLRYSVVGDPKKTADRYKVYLGTSDILTARAARDTAFKVLLQQGLEVVCDDELAA